MRTDDSAACRARQQTGVSDGEGHRMSKKGLFSCCRDWKREREGTDLLAEAVLLLSETQPGRKHFRFQSSLTDLQIGIRQLAMMFP